MSPNFAVNFNLMIPTPMRSRTLFCCTAIFVSAFFASHGQSPDSVVRKDWYLLDPEADHVQGVSVERTYATVLQGKPSKTVIVAVIDSGIDTDHEDLKSVLWTNPNEIAGNGIDDDKNGYIDDIHGWNFIGGKNGEVNEDTYELTREFMRLDKKFGNLQESLVPKKQRKEFESYLLIKDKYTKLRDKNRTEYEYYLKLSKNLKLSMDTLKATLRIEHVTREAIDTFRSTNPSLSFAKGFANFMMKSSDNPDLEAILKELQEAIDYYRVIVEYGYNPDFDSRQVIGDDYANPHERFYGNNNVKGPDSKHGTHVAGIIGADRSNGIGIKGIADNVRIMSVRAVPNGDERDKDIANAIRYAVDNGAKIINMSFGKSFSPEKSVVDEAVVYAGKKGVLLIHAAGNEHDDNDKEDNFPNRKLNSGKEARNWIEVGASAAGTGKNFVADFSNYGKKSVDLFAPGVDIYSTTPENKYENQSGTSMASPVAAGVAALIWSYFPDLTVNQVIDVLTQSTRKFDGLKVKKPGGGDASFSDLSKTGGLINAFEAATLASKLKALAVK